MEMNVAITQAVVKNEFFEPNHHQTLIRYQREPQVESKWCGKKRTPCECTIPLGTPVVPDENMTTAGLWNGSCSCANRAPVSRRTKSSKDVLDVPQLVSLETG